MAKQAEALGKEAFLTTDSANDKARAEVLAKTTTRETKPTELADPEEQIREEVLEAIEEVPAAVELAEGALAEEDKII
jgi:hypothetical protein